MQTAKSKRASFYRGRVLTSAVIVTVAQLGQSAMGGTTGSAVTISTSGSTALKNWFTAGTFTDIQPGTTLSINGVSYPTAGTSEWAVNGGNAYTYQLAPSKYNGGVTVEGQPADQASAVRLEYHESGSVEGILEMANDQIAPVTYVTQNVNRDPYVGIGNAVWVNYSQIGGKATALPWNVTTGADTSSTGSDDYHLGDFYSGGQTFVQGGNAQPAFNSSGTNLNGGQNAVQMALSDAIPVQVFAADNIATSSTTPWNLTPQNSGFGQGNTKLTASALGSANARQVYQSTGSLNMSAGAVNPRSSTGATFGTGPWNSAELGNLNSQTVATTATLFVANPGTGMTRVDRTDAQWLLTTGRLQNGATFNMTTRDVNSGTRNVSALETGIDPTWAVGVNDNGNGNALDGAAGQVAIGASLRFSNKTAGGNELRPTVQIARMAIGTLSINDASGDTGSVASFANPLRALSYSDSTDGSKPYVAANYYTIAGVTNSTQNPSGNQYTIFQNEQEVTLKAPDASYASTSPNIQGDDATNDVKTLINNTLTSVQAYQSSAGALASPAAGLMAQGYIIPQLMAVQKAQNGLSNASASAITSNLGGGASNYNSSLATGPVFNALVSKLTMGDPSQITSGPSSSVYGGSTLTGPPAGFHQNIGLTSFNSGAGGNYLFGNFNQTGVRDFDSAVVQAQKVQAALESQAGDSAFTADGGLANNTAVTTGIPALDAMQSQNQGSTVTGAIGATKGDLIVLGDYNGDGKFDGRDLYQMAVGASLTSSTSLPTETIVGGVPTFTTGHIIASASTFGNAIASSVLNKNVALDYLQYNANSLQKAEAKAVLTAVVVPAGATDLGTVDPESGYEQFTYDPTGSNAFNKSDVNQDGVVDFNDALAVDALNGMSYSNMSNALTATERSPVTGATVLANLVLAQQIDNESTIGSGDLAVINAALTGTGTSNWYGYGAIKSGPGTILFNRSAGSTVNLYAGASLNISSGTIQVASTMDPFTQNSNTGNPATTADTSKSLAIVVSSGGVLKYSGGINPIVSGIENQRLSSLNISGGTVTIDPATLHTNRTLLLAGSLTISGSSKLDLGNSDLVVQQGDLTAITGLVKNGFAGGARNAAGISSSAANSDSTHLTALGVIQNSPTGATSGVPLYSSFDGVTSASADVLVKYTYYGDANLDGKVDSTDYSRIDNAFVSQTGSGWFNGDFNYDGVVNGSDYTLIDNAFNTQGANLNVAAQFASPVATPTTEIAGFANLSAVPEPSTLGLFTVIAGSLLSRRRRRA